MKIQSIGYPTVGLRDGLLVLMGSVNLVKEKMHLFIRVDTRDKWTHEHSKAFEEVVQSLKDKFGVTEDFIEHRKD